MVTDNIQFNSLMNQDNYQRWGRSIQERLDDTFAKWIRTSREIKEWLGYKDDDFFEIVNVQKNSIIYYTNEGKMTFTFSKQVLEEEEHRIWEWKWNWGWYVMALQEFEDWNS